MSNTKTTKRALLTSIMALMLCFAMLTGTTFAWFTDTETSSNNRIVAGTLDVDLQMDKAEDGNYVSIAGGSGDIFKEGANANDSTETLWEPGKTQVVYLAVANLGNLALKYNIVLNVTDEDTTDAVNLADVLEFAVVDYGKTAPATRIDAWDASAAVPTLGSLLVDGKVVAAPNGQLKVGESDYFALAVHMQEEAGNEYQGKSISIDVTVVATQLNAEDDSFGKDYDKDAEQPKVGTVTVSANNTEVELSTDTVKVTVPASATAEGDVYKIEVSNESTETDVTTGETTVAFDLTVYKNNAKVSGDTVYEVTKNVGAGLFLSEVTHNGTALTKANTGADQTYTYDIATGILTIYTKSFSPFTVTYNDYVDYVRKLNIAHTQTSYISRSTGGDFLPIAAIMPEITGYSVYDGDTRITDSVCFRFSEVAKQTIDENSYKVSFNLAVKDDKGNDLELKPGMPSTINGKEYIHFYVNLLEVPADYFVSDVKVNGNSLTKTTKSSPATGEYMLGYEAKDLYFQSETAGLIEVIVTKAN